jgi:hypothetical protein
MKTKLHKWSGFAKRALPRAIWQPIRSLGTCILVPIQFSIGTGHGKSSFLMRAVDSKGGPIPWYTYPAIDFLGQRRYHDKTILEFGGGQSTLWWAARAKSVLSIEEDPHWFTKIQVQVPNNAEVRCILDPASIKAFLKSRNRKFDIIVVDGGARRELTRLSFDYLLPGGALILDNSDGYGFYDEIKDRLCSRIDFFGFAPGVLLRHCTSIVFVDECFLLTPDVPIPDLN